MGFCLLGVGRHAEALETSERAAALYRRLVEANPAARTPDFARTVSNVGHCLAALGRQAEAIAAFEKAAALTST